MVQTVKNLPAIQVPSLYCIVHPKGQEDPLKKGMASHSSILAWEIPRTEEPDGLQSMGSPGSGHLPMNCHLNCFLFSLYYK